jgi:hypothetical protein
MRGTRAAGAQRDRRPALSRARSWSDLPRARPPGHRHQAPESIHEPIMAEARRTGQVAEPGTPPDRSAPQRGGRGGVPRTTTPPMSSAGRTPARTMMPEASSGCGSADTASRPGLCSVGRGEPRPTGRPAEAASLREHRHPEVDIRCSRPGFHRVDCDPADETSACALRSGTARLATTIIVAAGARFNPALRLGRPLPGVRSSPRARATRGERRRRSSGGHRNTAGTRPPEASAGEPSTAVADRR